MDQILDRHLSEKDLGRVSNKFPRKHWKLIFIKDFEFTDAELQHAEYDNRGNGFKGVILTLLLEWRKKTNLHLKRRDLFDILQKAYKESLFSSAWYLEVFRDLDGSIEIDISYSCVNETSSCQEELDTDISDILREWYRSPEWLHQGSFPGLEGSDETAFLMDIDVSFMKSDTKVFNTPFEHNGSKNLSASSSNMSFSSHYDTFLLDGINRILAVGDLGMGKTMLCKKIAKDWTSDKLPRSFRFVFVLELRKMRPKESVAEAILNQCPYFGDTKVCSTQIVDILKNTDTLLILDGYDEKQDNQEVDDAISRRKYRNCCVMLTSRQHCVTKLEHLMEVKVKLDGFRRQQFLKFSSHQLGSESAAESFEDCIADNHLDSLTNVPLFAMILCQIYRERKTAPLPLQKKHMFDLFIATIKTYRPMQQFSGEEISRAREVLSELACKGLLDQNKPLSCKTTTLCDIKPLGYLVKHNLLQHSRSFTSQICFIHEAFKYYFAATGISEKHNTCVLDRILNTSMNSLEQFLDASLLFNLLFGFGNSSVNTKVLQHLGELYHKRDYGISSSSYSMVDGQVYFNDDSGCEDQTTDLNEIAVRLVAMDTKQHEKDLCSIIPLCHNLYKECTDRSQTFSSRPQCNRAIYIVDFEAESDVGDLRALAINFIPRNIVFRNLGPDSTLQFPEIILVNNSDSNHKGLKCSFRSLDSTWSSTFCRDLSSWIRQFIIQFDIVVLTTLSLDVELNLESETSTPFSQCPQKLATALIQPGLEQLVVAASVLKPSFWSHMTGRLQGCHLVKHIHISFVDITSDAARQLAASIQNMPGLLSFALLLDFTDKDLTEWQEPCTQIVAALHGVTGLEKLSLKVIFTEESLKALGDSLFRWKRTICSLCLISEQLVSCSTLLKSAAQCRMLENLCMIQMDLSGQLHELLRRPSNITKLVLMKCQLSDLDAEHIVSVLQSSRLPLLAHIDVRHNKISDTDVVTNAFSRHSSQILLLCYWCTSAAHFV